MRVVFLGTPTFAVPAFRMLLKHAYEICGVFTQPDRPSGRGQKLQSGPVKTLALEQGIPVFQPARIRNEENRAIFKELRPDFIVVVAYGQILPGWLLRSASIAPINIHGSLLPRYRGAAPIAWAIINGEKRTGVTTMLMEEELDSGPILMQQEVSIPMDKTAGELTDELSMVGAELLIKTLEAMQSGTVTPIGQDAGGVCWAPIIKKEMARISWQKRAEEVHNQIRGMNPWPVAGANFRNTPLRIWRSALLARSGDTAKMPGTLLGHTEKGILIQCGEGTILEVLEVQMPAKAKVTGREFANGARVHAGELVFQ
jgi:methionyl-tRNA formyltransferase